MTTRRGPRPLDAISALSLCVAAGIHAVVVPDHLREWWVAGAFFIVATVIQALGPGQIIGGVTRPSALACGLVNLALIGTWALSRTSGLPFGPQAGVPESSGLLDVAAVVCEVVAITGYAAMFAGAPGRPSIRRPRVSHATAIGAVVVASVVAAAGASAMPRGAHGHENITTPAGSPAHPADGHLHVHR
jgi:hypothetical protein